MTSKQRSYLKGLAMTMDPIFQIGKSSVTPELTAAVAEALEGRVRFTSLGDSVPLKGKAAGFEVLRAEELL